MAEKKRNRQNASRVVTSGTIRMEPPKSHRKPKPRTARDVHPVGSFANFLREYTVITLAIGFVIATQVQGLVKQLVADFINPLSQLLFATRLSQRTFTLHFHTHYANFAWGDLVYGLIEFLFVLIILYLTIKIFRLDKLKKPKDK